MRNELKVVVVLFCALVSSMLFLLTGTATDYEYIFTDDIEHHDNGNRLY